MLGLYIHIPFCATKCAYCDFYSLKYNKETVEKYVEEVCRRLKKLDNIFDTVYFGGGTPSLVGAENLSKILSNVTYKQGAEITVEVNPKSFKSGFFEKLYKSGFNRVSIGAQSAIETELKTLTRKHSFSDVEKTVFAAKSAGFKNISIDVMVGISGQTLNSLKKTLDKCIALEPAHFSCYMLKIEESTPYADSELVFPNDEEVSEMYLFLCNYLKKHDYIQYEVSNFSKEGLSSTHNTLYWKCEEYLGVGPAAHSYLKGKRYYFPNDIEYFLEGKEMMFLEDGDELYDYVMLGLRLSEGIEMSRFENNIGFIEKFKKYCKAGYASICNGRMFLNEKGFLVQNIILNDLLEEIQ